MHTINSGYFRLVALWSSSSFFFFLFFVTFSFGDLRCPVTQDKGEGWVSGWGGMGVFLGGLLQNEECWKFAFKLTQITDVAFTTQTSACWSFNLYWNASVLNQAIWFNIDSRYQSSPIFCNPQTIVMRNIIMGNILACHRKNYTFLNRR